jgi:hypothetical protein
MTDNANDTEPTKHASVELDRYLLRWALEATQRLDDLDNLPDGDGDTGYGPWHLFPDRITVGIAGECDERLALVRSAVDDRWVLAVIQ